MKKRFWGHIIILATLSLLALILCRYFTGTKYSYSKDDFIGLVHGGSGINRSDKIEDTSVLAIVKTNGDLEVLMPSEKWIEEHRTDES